MVDAGVGGRVAAPTLIVVMFEAVVRLANEHVHVMTALRENLGQLNECTTQTYANIDFSVITGVVDTTGIFI